MANFQKLQLSLILRVAGQIWQILQISAVIRRILQIPRGTANSKPKFHSKKLAKVCSQKILQFKGEGSRMDLYRARSCWVLASCWVRAWVFSFSEVSSALEFRARRKVSLRRVIGSLGGGCWGCWGWC